MESVTSTANETFISVLSKERYIWYIPLGRALYGSAFPSWFNGTFDNFVLFTNSPKNKIPTRMKSTAIFFISSPNKGVLKRCSILF
jgi:hypothetical protein